MGPAMVSAEWLRMINYPSRARVKSNTPKRCKHCQKAVRWCEKSNGYHVCLDWYPSSTGRWRIHESGVAQEMPPHHEGGWAMYDRHVCEVP